MLEIKHNYSVDKIVSHLQNANPSKKQTFAKSLAKWNQYLELITREVEQGIILGRRELIKKEQFQMTWDSFRSPLGKCRNFGYYIDWFHQHYPLVKIITLGKPGQLTVTELIFDLAIVASSQTPKEAFESAYSQFQDEEFDIVPIDMRSLDAYIQANQALQQQATDKLKPTLVRNLLVAKSIYLCAEYCNGQLPQAISESQFGRKYYKGLNLQNCPKIVRAAALGHCHQYDINTSVFSWRLDLAKKLDPSIKLPHLIEYVDEKDQRRNQLADVLDIPGSREFRVGLIKEVMTSIGFGSQPNSNWHGASLNTIIKSHKARQRLKDNEWFKNFVAEQKTVNELILKHYQEQFQDSELKSNSFLSYLYQQYERQVIDLLTAPALEDGSLLLVVHDGFYTSKKLNYKDILIDIRATLNSELTIDHSQVTAYAFDPYQLEHKNRMLDEELRANQYARSKGIEPMFSDQQIYNKHRYFDRRFIAAHDNGSRDGFDAGYRSGEYSVSNYDQELDPYYT
jgi:hypothetical protein